MLSLLFALLFAAPVQASQYTLYAPTVTVYAEDTTGMHEVSFYAKKAKAFFDSLQVPTDFQSAIYLASSPSDFNGAAGRHLRNNIEGLSIKQPYGSTQVTLVKYRDDLSEVVTHELVHQIIYNNERSEQALTTRRLQEGIAVIMTYLVLGESYTVTIDEVTTDDLVAYLSDPTPSQDAYNFTEQDYEVSAAAVATLTHNDPHKLAAIINGLHDGTNLEDILCAAAE